MITTIQINDHASPAVQRFVAGLQNRQPVHQAIGNRVKALIRDHTIAWAGSHHATANRLGASPSNFVAQAAESVETGTPTPDAEGVSIKLPHPHFARAFGPVNIRPKSGLYLTIPLVAAAYNQRAYRIQGLFFWKSKTGKAFLAESIGAGGGVKSKLRLWYLLVQSVLQGKDASRLPSPAAIAQAAVKAVGDYLQLLLKTKEVARG